MDKKQLSDLEHEAINDAGRFAVVFGISFAVLAAPTLSAGNLPSAKALIVSAAIAGASEAVKKTKPMWQKLFQDAIASLQNRKPAPPADPTTAATVTATK